MPNYIITKSNQIASRVSFLNGLSDIQNLPIENENVYFIDIVLDNNNPINYDGVQEALKFYFKLLQNDILNFRIVLFGFEDLATFYQDCAYSMFLKCAGVLYVEVETLVKNENVNPVIVNKDEAINALKNISIKAPSSYKSHHSIANEWAIDRWSKALRLTYNNELSYEIENSLYFQYLRTIYNTSGIETLELSLNGKGNLLLIDDEEGKGWRAFLDAWKGQYDKITIDSIGKDFKTLDRIEIIKQAKEKIGKFKPDVILLDLRLHDSDFDVNTPEKLIGFEILRIVKEEINKGIQVIIFTASNKIWNFQSLNAVGFDGWIIKESPEDSNNNEYTEKALNELAVQVQTALKKAKLLIPIYDKMIESIKVWKQYKLPKKESSDNNLHDLLHDTNLKQQVIDFISNAFDTIANVSVKERFTMSIVLLYRVIEMINEYFILESGTYKDKNIEYKFDVDSTKIPLIRYQNNQYTIDENYNKGTHISTLSKSYAIYYKLNKKTNNSLFNGMKKLTDYRNNIAIHPEKRFKEESLEYLYDTNINKFNQLITNYFEAVLDYVKSFK